MILAADLSAASGYALLTAGLGGIALVVAMAPRRKSAATLAIWLGFTSLAGSGVLHVLAARSGDGGWANGLLLAAGVLLATSATLAVIEFRNRERNEMKLASELDAQRREVERLTGAAVRLEDELSETRRTLRKADERSGTASVAAEAAVMRHKKSAEASAAAAKRMRAVIDCAVDGVFLLERESLRIADANPAALALCGRDRKAAAELGFLDLLGGDGPKLGRTDLLRCAREKRILAASFGRPDGSSVAVEITVSAVGEGDDAQVLAVVRDASERAVAERDWELSLGGLREKVRAAEEKSRAAAEQTRALELENIRITDLQARKDEYMGMVSHELRTPLTSIRSFSEILLKHGDSEPAIRHEFLGIINKESERLTRMINNVLDLARIEAGATRLNMTEFDARTVATDAAAALKGMSAEREVRIAVDAGDAPRLLRADRDRIQQLVMNLVGNALKFSERGGEVVLRIEDGDAQGRVRFAVEDRGCGIAPEDLGRIFEKFQRVENGSANHEGTGLGLAICREIVTLHGGRIWAESTPGKGSTFRAELPGPDEARRTPAVRPGFRAAEPAARGARPVPAR
ncbi:MAG: Adaptive-response sensory-kinase SasA [Planctomycetes bacterium]|nr:Adaptive-response sensory-kinase SasA [Planctomycetota bacterium]